MQGFAPLDPELLMAAGGRLNMLRIVMVSLLAVGLVGQQPPDESNVPAAEKRIPPGHYCKHEGVPIGPTETRAHSCACSFACSVDEDGNVTEQESPNCLAYCHVNNRRCTCHVEEPTKCEGSPQAQAWVDMDGRLVAVAVRSGRPVGSGPLRMARTVVAR